MTIEQLSSKATSERTSRAVSRAPTGMGFTSVLGDAASTHMGKVCKCRCMKCWLLRWPVQ